MDVEISQIDTRKTLGITGSNIHRSGTRPTGTAMHIKTALKRQQKPRPSEYGLKRDEQCPTQP